jgi:hypothetical protein
MKRTPMLRLVLLGVFFAPAARADILRTPTAVNVSSQGATTVFISYGQLANQVSVEALWCGRLIPATPAIGMMCDPATVWGRLPLRYDQSQASGARGFTDIMTIPQSLARRAYEAAERGKTQFFYVRRFESTTGGPDEYVNVVCRLTGGGAGVPLALLDVQVAFDTDVAVLSVQRGTQPPPIVADIAYTGTGRLKGRWEVVKPGDQIPSEQDLLTEATLPEEQRFEQRRYLELERFNVFLPPTGRYRLAGPDPRRLPSEAEGLYVVLLRVEASNDLPGDVDLGSVEEGGGLLYTGGVAGFPMPQLRYYVGSADPQRLGVRVGVLSPLLPANGAVLAPAEAELGWLEEAGASFYQVEVLDSGGSVVAAAMLQRGEGSYLLPPWVAEKAKPGPLRWRVLALDPDGEKLSATDWRTFTFRSSPKSE